MDSQISPSTVMDLESMVIDESAEPKALPLSLLDEITYGFSQMQEIGSGGFAVVYEGILVNERVAVKKLVNVHIHEAEFHREVECLMRVKHRNIVRFLGYCADTQGSMQRFEKRLVMADVQKRLLCFEYVPNKSLHDYITDESHRLEWRRRYRIIKGVCDGLNYLHNNNIVHLDLKPANILMDENMDPKIADFGLSRCFDEDQSHVMATKVAGTLGYLPPEFNSRVITRAYDIYSLGVIIIEILTGEKGYHQTEDVVESWRNRLEVSHEASELEQIRVCANIGKECTKSNPAKRPCSVQDIIDRLEETESADESSAEQMKSSTPTERGLLHVHECQLRFPLFKPDKNVFSPLRLTNNTNDHIAFRCSPKFPESFIGGLSKLAGIVPPRSTRTFLVWMEKQPPKNIEPFDMVLESCVPHKDVGNMEHNFLPEIRQVGGKVHQVPLVAVCNPTGEPIQSQIKIICRYNDWFFVTMDVHPMEPWILGAQYNGSISIWNYETQEKLAELNLVEDVIVHTCKFIAREGWIVAADGHGVIHIRSCKTLELEEVKKFKAHTGYIQALAVHPSLPLLVTGGCAAGFIKLWDWEKDWTCLRTFKAHRVKVEALQFNPQNDAAGRITFASAAPDGKAMIWDIKLIPPIATLDCQEQLMDLDYFLPGGNEQYIITGSVSGITRIWDLQTHKCIRVIKGTSIGSAGCRVRVVYRHPDPPLLIRTFQDESLGLCNSTTFRYTDSINFGLEKSRNIVYVKGIRSVVIGFTKGLAILEIN